MVMSQNIDHDSCSDFNMHMVRIFLIGVAICGISEVLTDLIFLGAASVIYGVYSKTDRNCYLSCFLSILFTLGLIFVLLKLFLFVWSIVGGINIFPIWLNCHKNATDHDSTHSGNEDPNCSCDNRFVLSAVGLLIVLYVQWIGLIKAFVCTIMCRWKAKDD